LQLKLFSCSTKRMFTPTTKTQIIGRNLLYLPTCYSTNDEAQQYLQQPHSLEGTVIITDHQIAGRGQRGNSWVAEPNQNLTFSLILSPKFLQAIEQFKLNVAISVGIADGLLNYVPIQIKWSNDMYCESKKIAGILIENILQHTHLRHSIIGIGINVNQIFDTVIGTTKTKIPTSLFAQTNQRHDLQTVLETVLLGIERRYLQLLAGQYDAIKAIYLQRLFWYQEQHIFESAGKQFVGMITGIDVYGRLAVAVQNQIQYFDVKEIAFIK
jgi:BirA family biotin operon repressor/biotin-[acetyl-CoA-carboxylase] ligase